MTFICVKSLTSYAKFIYSSLLDGQPLLASGGSSGVISIWNLEKRRLQSVIKEAHDGSILSLHFFVNEPVLMSSASDNSIKVRAITCYFLVFITFYLLFYFILYAFSLVVQLFK